MDKTKLKNLIKEVIKEALENPKSLNERGPDKYVGKYKGVNMYIDDEGNYYIKGKQTNFTPVAIKDSEGTQRSDQEIRQDVLAAQKQSYKDWKMDMRYGNY
jgi:hypothetical protein